MADVYPLAELERALQQGDDDAAERATHTLTAAAEPALLAWLESADPEQRWWAARALAHCGGPAAAPALVQTLTVDDPALRSVASYALGHLYQRVPDAVRPLLPQLARLLADGDGGVRQVTADALALCGDDAVPALAAVLQGDHEGARTRAAASLRKIASIKAAGVLFRCLNDPNYMVHTYAHEALDEMGLLENMLVMPG
jgi:HEAT repeat protein